MNRDQLSHCLRAASRIADDDRIVVIGSQSILGSFDESILPAEVKESIEVDLAFIDDEDEEKANAVDGAIGELSQFHETYGYYAQGVSLSTAVLPPGWQSRVAEDRTPDSRVGAVYLDPYDCVSSKLVAYRGKDREFATALLDADLLDAGRLRDRAELLPERSPHEHNLPSRGHVLAWIDNYTLVRRAQATTQAVRPPSSPQSTEAGPISDFLCDTKGQDVPRLYTQLTQICGAWMPRARTKCGRPLGHRGHHRRR